MDIKTLTTITRSRLAELFAALTAKPTNYNKPVRIYCDVDGVIQPLVSIDELENPSDYVQVELKVIPHNSGWSEEIELRTTTFFYNKAIVERLSALSRSPFVDFVWLTSWRINAPLVLDEVLNIKSVGMLDWQLKLGDHSQHFKSVAIEEEQAAAPAPYVWIDDHANLTIGDGSNDEPIYPWLILDDEDEDDVKNASVEHLRVTTAGRTGLVHDEIDLIENWVQEHATVSS